MPNVKTSKNVFDVINKESQVIHFEPSGEESDFEEVLGIVSSRVSRENKGQVNMTEDNSCDRDIGMGQTMGSSTNDMFKLLQDSQNFFFRDIWDIFINTINGLNCLPYKQISFCMSVFFKKNLGFWNQVTKSSV